MPHLAAVAVTGYGLPKAPMTHHRSRNWSREAMHMQVIFGLTYSFSWPSVFGPVPNTTGGSVCRRQDKAAPCINIDTFLRWSSRYRGLRICRTGEDRLSQVHVIQPRVPAAADLRGTDDCLLVPRAICGPPAEQMFRAVVATRSSTYTA